MASDGLRSSWHVVEPAAEQLVHPAVVRQVVAALRGDLRGERGDLVEVVGGVAVGLRPGPVEALDVLAQRRSRVDRRDDRDELVHRADHVVVFRREPVGGHQAHRHRVGVGVPGQARGDQRHHQRGRGDAELSWRPVRPARRGGASAGWPQGGCASPWPAASAAGRPARRRGCAASTVPTPPAVPATGSVRCSRASSLGVGPSSATAAGVGDQGAELVGQVVDRPDVHDQVGEGQRQEHRRAVGGDHAPAPEQAALHRERHRAEFVLGVLRVLPVADHPVHPLDRQVRRLVDALHRLPVDDVVGGAQRLVPVHQHAQRVLDPGHRQPPQVADDGEVRVLHPVLWIPLDLAPAEELTVAEGASAGIGSPSGS